MLELIIAASVWLIVAPALMPFTPTQTWICVVAGVVTVILAYLRPLGRARFYCIIAGAACLIIAGFIFRGQALATCFIGGTTLLPASLVLASQAQDRTSPAPDDRGESQGR